MGLTSCQACTNNLGTLGAKMYRIVETHWIEWNRRKEEEASNKEAYAEIPLLRSGFISDNGFSDFATISASRFHWKRNSFEVGHERHSISIFVMMVGWQSS